MITAAKFLTVPVSNPVSRVRLARSWADSATPSSASSSTASLPACPGGQCRGGYIAHEDSAGFGGVGSGDHLHSFGYTNLVVRKRDGHVELDPHVDGSCVVSLDSAGALHEALGEWLGCTRCRRALFASCLRL